MGVPLHALPAQRLLEHRRGEPRFQEAVAFRAWQLQKRYKQDAGYKVSSLEPCMPHRSEWSTGHASGGGTEAPQ